MNKKKIRPLVKIQLEMEYEFSIKAYLDSWKFRSWSNYASTIMCTHTET